MTEQDRLVVIAVYPGFQALDAVGPHEVFAIARLGLGGAGYRVLVASVDGQPVRSDSGLLVGVDARLADLPEVVDTVVVVGGIGYEQAARSAELVGELRGLAGRARRVCSVCTGAFLLAAAGLLNGRSATTHWGWCGPLAAQFPEVSVEPDRIFVRDGGVYTSAGVTAGMDLTLALVEEDHGAMLARDIARMLVLFLQRPGGQSQFSARLQVPLATGTPVRPILDSIVADPTADHRVPALAQRAALSERHLSRLFTDHTGTTPARFVERVRVEVARDLLERTLLPIDAVSSRSGFGGGETMRRAFLRVLGVAPSDYRNRFRSTAIEGAR